MLAPLHDRLQPGAERQRRLSRPRPAARGHNADLGIEEQVEADALLGPAPVQPERLPVAAHELDPLVGEHAAESAAALGDQESPVLHGRSRAAPRSTRSSA